MTPAQLDALADYLELTGNEDDFVLATRARLRRLSAADLDDLLEVVDGVLGDLEIERQQAAN